MSMSTASRSGGAVLYRCLQDREAVWPLARMQQDMNRIAEKPQERAAGSAARPHREGGHTVRSPSA